MIETEKKQKSLKTNKILKASVRLFLKKDNTNIQYKEIRK